MGIANAVFTGLNAISVGSDALGKIKDGKGIIPAVASAGAEFLISDALFGMLGGPAGLAMFGVQLASGAAQMAAAVGKRNYENMNHATRYGGGGRIGGQNVINSQAAYTMRQRGVQALQYNEQNARGMLGSEARSYVHKL